MKTVSYYADTNRSGNLLHIETDGCIINIRVGFEDSISKFTSIEVLADRNVGDEWEIDNPDLYSKEIKSQHILVRKIEQ